MAGAGVGAFPVFPMAMILPAFSGFSNRLVPK